jgi:transcriptional regulator with XRE-family HTH domain
MAVGFGDRIRAGRRQRGWNQAELARRLGVGQQAVSQWEMGRSHPSRNTVGRLAVLLDLDPRDLLEAADFTRSVSRPQQVRRPVRPRLTVLPVSDLAPEKFEEFVAEIAHHLYPAAQVSRVGGPGHKQHGVDVIARQGSRNIATFQCKRRARFGPKDITDAVMAVTINADAHFLVLSRPSASPESRNEMANHKGWALWDAEDLSRVLRTLPLDTAVRIIDAFFPGWREPLLGVAEPGPWLSSDEFFQLSGVGHIYTHDWQLVGRSGELEDILSFVTGDRGRVGLVIGRGGIGKTRLLREVARVAEDRSVVVRFAGSASELKPAQFELLPAGQRLLVVIDDAHDRSDIAAVLGTLARARPHARIVLALRPYGLAAVAPDLRSIGVHQSEVPAWELADLSSGEAQALAREALGPEWPERVVRLLAGLTADCPLITVVGGVLIRRGHLDPACLDHQDTIRTEILKAFRKALVGDPLSAGAAMRSAVLDAVAVLQPFRSDDPAFQAAMGKLITAPFDRVVSHLRGLEDAGVLLRRGSSMRIVPDLLGDVILALASFDERSGASIGYIERAWTSAEGQPLQHIFVNATRLDWQIRHDRADVSSLASALWEAVEGELGSAGVIGRVSLLQLLRKVAHFEPERILAIARWLIDNPTNLMEPTDAGVVPLRPLTYADVLHELSPLLRGVAYSIDYVPAAADLLWVLAQADQRPANQQPDHALRVLRDLAEYEIGKPLAVNQLLIDAAERWLRRDDGSDSLHSPFEVLEPLLETEGSERLTDAFQISFRPFAIKVGSVLSLRERVIKLALAESRRAELRRAVRAVQAVETALCYPAGMFGREVPEGELAAWTPGFVATIEQLGKVVADSNLDPVVAIAARRALHWHAEYSTTSTRKAARRVLKAMPASLEHELALELFDGWGQLSEGPAEDFLRAEASKQARRQALAVALTDEYPDDALADILVRRLTRQQGAFGIGVGSPGQFIWTLVTVRPSLGVHFCSLVALDPDSVLLEVLPVVVAALATTRPDKAMTTIEDLLRTHDVRVRQQVAQALGWNRGSRTTLLDGELDILARLAHDPDEYVRTGVIRAIQRLAPDHQAAAVALITQVPFTDSDRVAAEIFQTFGPQGGLRWQQLPKDHADAMLKQLQECPSIGDYNTMSFLSQLSKDHPAVVLQVLKERIEHSERLTSLGDYRPLPFQWNPPLHVRMHPDLGTLLRELRDWIAPQPSSWQRQYIGGELFCSVAQPFDDAVIQILLEAIAVGDPDQLAAVVSIVRQAPSNVIFEETDFVARLFDAASRLGDEWVERVGAAMHAAVMSGIRTGFFGQPSDVDVDQRNQAREIASRLPRGSMEQQFYRSIEESADRNIRWQGDQDERLADRRDW